MKPKQWQNIFNVIVNENSIVQHAIQIKKGIMKHVNVSVKIIVSAKEIIVGILAHALLMIHDSVIACNEIMSIMDIK